MLAEAVIDIAPISRAALFLAGKVFQRYRALGGTRTGVLPELAIAHTRYWPLSQLLSEDHTHRSHGLNQRYAIGSRFRFSHMVRAGDELVLVKRCGSVDG